jgi:hypothetical protein
MALGGLKTPMPSDATLEIEDSFTIRGRGLVLILKAFRFVTPKGAPEPFSNNIVVISPDGTCEKVKAQFLIEHFSLVSENGDLYGRYSLVLLLPEKANAKLPAGSQIRVSESTLSLEPVLEEGRGLLLLAKMAQSPPSSPSNTAAAANHD